MVRLRVVDVCPWGGAVDRPWSDDPADDAFARSSRRVSELVNQALQSVVIDNASSSVRLLTGTAFPWPVKDDATVMVSVLADRIEGFDVANVLVPKSFLELHDEDRALVVLDVLTATLTELARHRSWDPAAVASLRDHALARSLHYVWNGPWKSSPDRRRRARFVGIIEADGVGRLTLEVETPASGELSSWGPYLSGCSPERFADVAKNARWTSSTTIRFDPVPPLGQEQRTPVEVNVSEPRAAAHPGSLGETVRVARHPMGVSVSSRRYNRKGQMSPA